MSHLHRFRIPVDTPREAEIDLPEEEAHHAARVVRLRPGERVALFDGRGREVLGRIAQIDKKRVSVAVDEDRTEPEPVARVTLVQAWLKRDKYIEEIIRHGTELGVARFVFFRAEHSEKTPKPDPKWERLAVEVCKQNGRLWLPEFEAVNGLSDAVAGSWDALLVATKDVPPVPIADAVSGRRVALAIGPEGDFTAGELELLRGMGARPVSLGDATFRSEVAAVVACTLVLYELGALGPGRV